MSDLQQVQRKKNARGPVGPAEEEAVEMTSDPKSDNRLVQRIRTALKSVPDKNAILRISVSDKPVWEKAKSGDFLHVRWICWSIEDCHGNELYPPEFDILSPTITRQRLADELPGLFPAVKVVVDDNIDA